MQITSKAKINLVLDITERRADGYHVVRMVMQTLALGDEIALSVRLSDATRISLSCSDPELPCDERNLAFRAAQLLTDICPDKLNGQEISIVIDKRIPVAAGLAGGSSDAAAVLAGLNELCELGLSREELMDLGLKLGADVPFCILQGTALAEGVGEKLTSLPSLTGIPVLLVKPDISVSTQWAYESWDELDDPYHPDIDALAEAVRTAAEGDDPQTAARRIAPHLGNTFEKLVFAEQPVVRQIKEDLLSLGAAGALMSGSGPTVFAIFTDQESMAAAAREMRSRYPAAFICETHME